MAISACLRLGFTEIRFVIRIAYIHVSYSYRDYLCDSYSVYMFLIEIKITIVIRIAYTCFYSYRDYHCDSQAAISSSSSSSRILTG